MQRCFVKTTKLLYKDNNHWRFSSSEVPIENKLIDNFHRKHNYLRMSLTEKCNLRCTYCMPENGVNLTCNSDLLTLNERKSVISLFTNLGINKIRFTGGEPTISNQLTTLIKHSYDIGIKSIGITTNGIELGRNHKRIDELLLLGLNTINISLDTLDSLKYSQMTKRSESNFHHVMSCIHYFLSKLNDSANTPMKSNFKLKINFVMIRNINDNEIYDIINEFIIKNNYPIDIRFIELMPFDSNQWTNNKLMNYIEAINEINNNIKIKNNNQLQLIIQNNILNDKNDTTKWYNLIDKINGNPFLGRIGFITSMSRYYLI